MGSLAWLLAMAGLGGASLWFASSAPEQAWWILALIAAGLLAGPHVVQWWLARPGRTGRLAARWWAGAPGPVEVAFICGGPDRVTDVVIAGLMAEGRLAMDDDGKLTAVGPGGGDGAPGELEEGFRRQILTRLSYGDADVTALRFSVRPTTATTRLWRSAVRQRLLVPAWRREYTHWYLAGALVVVGFGAAVALGDYLVFTVGVAALALGVVALWRPKVLTGYGFDPRTAAGQRAAELARTADRPGDRRHRTAVEGIRSVADLRPGPPGAHPVPASDWHVPWHARRVREKDTPWWQAVAQATTDYAETLGEVDGADGSAGHRGS